MVKYIKNGWLSRAIDGVTLGVTSFIGGYSLFALEWARGSWTWLSNLITFQLLPNSLSSYSFSTSVGEAFGLGVLSLLCAIVSSVYFKDNDFLDNPRQMLGGMLAGLIVTLGLLAIKITATTISEIGFVVSIVLMALYVLFRRD